MGIDGFWESTVGCKVHETKLRSDLKEADLEDMIEPLEGANYDIGRAMDFGKIFGYWHDWTRRYLDVCVNAMEGLSEWPGDNCIYYHYESDCDYMPDPKFFISFYKKEGKPCISVHYSEWATMTLKGPCEQTTNEVVSKNAVE